jgi:hypothetical protein
MNRLIVLLFIGLIVFGILFFISNPDVFNEVYLYFIGLFGFIVKGFQSFLDRLKKSFKKPEQNKKPNQVNLEKFNPAKHSPQNNDSFEGYTFSLLRYRDDGSTTLGLLYDDKTYFSFTLEDTYRKEKIPGETRIPAGTYEIKFREEPSESQAKYRKQYDWFTWHLELQNVPDFRYVYIHIGNYNEDTEGCILVASSAEIGDEKAYIKNSTETFRILYLRISEILNNGGKVRIIIKDEDWINQIHAA